MGARILKVVQVMQGCGRLLSFKEEAMAKLPILDILPILFAHLPVLILRLNPARKISLYI